MINIIKSRGTMKDSTEILEELFDKGITTHDFKIANKYHISIKNISSQDYVSIDENLSKIKKTVIGYTQEYILERISKVLVKINDTLFISSEDAKNYLLAQSASFSNKILTEHKKFEEAIKKALELDEIEENFFDRADSLKKQERP